MSHAYILIFSFLPFGVFTENGVLRLFKEQKYWGSPLLRHPFNYFPRYKNITHYLERIASSYNNTLSLEDIGTTYEERTIYVAKISSGGINKPKILIDAGMHGHEWMTPVVAIYTIHQLLKNKTNAYLYQNVDWYIIPCLNPDGYEFTFTSSNHWWRKNRSANEGSLCFGTDINRNFDIGWKGKYTNDLVIDNIQEVYKIIGKSHKDNPCSDFYSGFTPFSESESKALRNLFRSNKGLIKVYLTLHSFGMFFLYPWRWTKISTNNIDLHRFGNKAVKAITKRYNTRYTLNSAAKIIEVGGSSDDWMFAVGNGADLSYTLELPGHTYQMWRLPIEAIGIETLEAFKVFHSYIEKKYIKTDEEN